MVSDEDLRVYAEGLERNGFAGPNAWYMNHEANADYAARAHNGGRLDLPVLFLGGSNDWLIAPPWALLEYYIEVPGAAAMLVLNDADHLTIQGSGGRYLGYLTAWMMYQLQGDQYARGAFAGAPPEANANTNWSWQAEKNLS